MSADATTSPRPTPLAVETTLTFEEVGFKVTLPADWTVTEVRSDLVTARGQGTSLTVRVGTPDGRIQTCEVPGRAWERCRDVVVTNLEAFFEAVRMAPVVACTGLCGPPAAGPLSTTLGGADALRVAISGYEYPAHGGENALYVLALHQDRPYFLRFHTSANFAPGSPPGSVWKSIVESFAFVPPVAEAPVGGDTAPRQGPAATGTHSFPDAGFSIAVPTNWEVADDGSKMQFFGPAREMTIRIGDASGLLSNPCPTLGRSVYLEICEDMRIRTLDDFAGAFTSSLPFSTDEDPLLSRFRPASLGGEEARAFRIGGHDYIATIHQGRPYLLRHRVTWAFQPSAPRIMTWEAIQRSFVFLGAEGAGVGAGELVEFRDTGFEIRVPGSWTWEQDEGTIHMQGDGDRLTIRVGSPDGQLVTCERPARPWERCRTVRIANLDDLREAVATGPPAGCAWCVPGPIRKASTRLDSEDAWRVDFWGYEYPARSSETARYVLTVHAGRPYFIRFHTSAETGGPGRRDARWDEILASFAFLDQP